MENREGGFNPEAGTVETIKTPEQAEASNEILQKILAAVEA